MVVLEPGLGFAAPQYQYLAADLAGHGYLVAGVTPTYSANLTVLDGEAVHSNQAGNPSEFDGDRSRTALATSRRLLDRSDGPAWTVTLADSAHFSFTDYADYYLAAPLRLLIPLGSVDARQGCG